MKTKNTMLFMVLAALMVFSAACGNSQAQGESGQTSGGTEKSGAETENTSEDNQQVLIDGSSTVFPIMEAVSEEFSKEHPDIEAPVGVSGSGGGFEKFTVGETDLSNASRPIKPEEKQIAEENGIAYTELELAFDGLSVVVNKENDWIDHLTVEELAKIWTKGSGVKTWADVREGWPDEPIQHFSPGTDSGTYDYFSEVIVGEDNPYRRQGVQFSEDDNVLVQGVAGTKQAIGYFGYAYYLENKDKLKVVPIQNPETGEFVEPTGETIQSGAYAPLSRPLFTYVNHEHLKNKDAVYQYVKFMLENAGTFAEEVGYVALPDEQYQKQLDTINDIAGK